MPDKFKAGDVVRLRSGGPKMTVVEYGVFGLGETERTCLCRWFDDKHQVTERSFSDPELELIVAPAAGAPGGPSGPNSWMR
jgi:uncharacterized protein YodC (DUF2158 family)